MTTGSDQHATELLRDGRVVGPWTCLRCRYGIENLRPTDPCPECGGAIDQSLDPRLLRFTTPATIDRVRRGARGIGLSVLASVLSIPAAGIYFATVDAMESRGLSVELSYFLNGPVFPFILIYGVMALMARSVFKYTTPLPASCEPSRATAQLRRALRCFVIAIPAMFTPFAALITLEWLWSVYFDNVVPVWIAVLVASCMAGTAIALVFGLSLYAWSIGDRTWAYRKPLSVIARAPAVFACISATLAIIVGALSEPFMTLMDAPAWGIFQWLYFSLWLAWTLFGVLALLLSLVTVDAVRSAATRDFREAFKASASSRTNQEEPAA
jgi:hypothetical protein